MIPCSPSACPLTSHGDPSPQHSPSLANWKAMPHMSRAQCKVQWWDMRAERVHMHKGLHKQHLYLLLFTPRELTVGRGHSLRVEADWTIWLLLCCCHSPSSSHHRAGWPPVSSRRKAPGSRTSPIWVVEGVILVTGSVTALPSPGFRGGKESSLLFNQCLGQQVLVMPKFLCSHWLNYLLMHWQGQSKARTSPALSAKGLGAVGVSPLQGFRHVISIPALRCQTSWLPFVATESHFQTDLGDREREKRACSEQNSPRAVMWRTCEELIKQVSDCLHNA